MIKKLLTVVLILSLALTAAGCGSTAELGGEPAAASEEMTVLDKEGNRLGAISSRASCTAADGGIFYSIFEPEEYQFTADAEYRFFDRESESDVSLGILENQGYEAVFSRTEYGGIIYTLAVIGSPMSGDPVPLILIACDPAEGTMKKYVVSENGFPYAAMAASGGKLLIMNHETADPKCDKIYEYDPSEDTVREVMSFSAETDSLRGICSAADGFYLLRLKIGSGGNEMFIDSYDNDFHKVSERSVNEALIKAAMKVPGIISRQDALDELGMNVSRFSVEEGRFLVYENFSLTRLILDLQTEEAVLVSDDLHSFSVGSGRPYLYRMDFDPDNMQEPEISGIKDGEITKLDFIPADEHRLIRSVSHSAGGTWLVLTSDVFSAQDSSYAVYLWSE